MGRRTKALLLRPHNDLIGTPGLTSVEDLRIAHIGGDVRIADVEAELLTVITSSGGAAPDRRLGVCDVPAMWMSEAPVLPRYVSALCVWLGSGCGLAGSV